uniref:Uncharacterized protein n=1 Tax=Rhizophora mucronata TaxID=61149 RepID=A0A2P2NVC8_RHIMU
MLATRIVFEVEGVGFEFLF